MTAHGGTRAGGMNPLDVGTLRPALVRGGLAAMAAAWVAVIAHASGSRGAALPLALALLAAVAALAFLLIARGARGKPSAGRFGELTTERTLALGDRAGLRNFFARVLILATLAFLLAAVISAAFPGRLVAAGIVAAILAPAFLASIGMIGRGGANGWIVDLTVANAGAAARMAAYGEGQQFRWGWSRAGRLAGLRAFLAQDGDAPAAARAILWARYAPGAGVIRPEMRVKSVLDELRARRAGWRTAAGVCVAAAVAAMLAASLIPRGTLGSVPPLGALQFRPPDKAEAAATDNPARGSDTQPDRGASDRQSSGQPVGNENSQESGASVGNPDNASGGREVGNAGNGNNADPDGAAPTDGQDGTEGSAEAGGAETAPMGGRDGTAAGEDHAAQEASDGTVPGQGAAMDGKASTDSRTGASPEGDGARVRPDVTDTGPRPTGPEVEPGKATQEESGASTDDAAGLEQVHPADATQGAKPEDMTADAAEGAGAAGAEDAPGPGQARPANATATDGGADTAPDTAAGAPDPAHAGPPAVAVAQQEGGEAAIAVTETPADADQEDIEIGTPATLFAEKGVVPEAVERTFGPQDRNPPLAPGPPSPPRQPLPAWIEALLP